MTHASIHDSIVYLQRLDAGYSTPGICKGLIEREIYGAIGYRRNNSKDGIFRKSKFTYDLFREVYICHENKVLEYRTTNRNGYKEYASDCKIYVECPFCKECNGSKNHIKVISRHIWQKYKEAVDRHRLEEKGKLIYKRRKETIERSFADAKELHGYKYARMRGINKVR